MAIVVPIQDPDLLEVCAFLQQHLNPRLSLAEWALGFQQPWLADRPNHGFMLRDEGRVVGVFAAYYSHRLVRGRDERFVNVHSWVVLPEYRGARGGRSLDLLRAFLAQPGYHILGVTPNPQVLRIFEGFKFTLPGTDAFARLCLPLPGPRGVRVVSEPAAMLAAMEDEPRRHYLDHRVFPWLRHLLVGRPGAWCYVIHRPGRLKRLPSQRILHLSEPSLLAPYARTLGRHWLRQGFMTLQVEARLLEAPLPWAIRLPDRQPTGFVSGSLRAHEMTNLYTEWMAMDM